MAFVLLTNKKVRGAIDFTIGLIVGYILVAFIVIFSSFPTDHPYLAWGLAPLAIASLAVYYDPLAHLMSFAADSVVPGSATLVAAVTNT